MIYVQLTGGLGNQMYGYAIGYALAKEYGDRLTIDLSAYPHSPRPFVLDRFNISANVESISPARSDCKIPRMFARMGRIIRTWKYGHCRWMKEDVELSRNKYYPYDFSHKKSLYLEGYWQNYRYFDKYKKELSKELGPKEGSISEECKKLMEECRGNKKSVALHIRRGDYAAEWCIGDDYYNEAISRITDRLGDAKFYIFCEDKECAAEYMSRLPGATYVTGNYKLDDIEEFFVMSTCNHHITANSSYSFWAAYLANSEDQIVTAPVYLHWGKDYYPKNWVTIDIKRNA